MFPGAITQLSCVQRCHLECARRTQTLGVCVDVPLASHPGETERERARGWSCARGSLVFDIN